MKGAAHGRAVLTEDDVRKIRELYEPGNRGGRPETTVSPRSLHGLAHRFGVSHRQIFRIVKGQNWREV